MDPHGQQASVAGAVSRRYFIKGLGLGFGALSWGGLSTAALREAAPLPPVVSAADLPAGSAPKPLPVDHFPDRLHAFVWRNWTLVPAKRLARVVRAKTSEILRLGRSMGLDAPPSITLEQQSRSTTTVIRRNWHLLPYEQLLELLGWTPEQLEFALREDDFLFIKLGRLKPACEPLRYRPPDAAAAQRAREIASISRREFPGGVARSYEPLFGFISELSRKPRAGDRPPASADLRFCYSYFALTGDPLLEPKADPYPEGYLARLAQAGVNGVWLPAVLHKLAVFPWEPGRSEGYHTRLRNLRQLVERAARYGVRIFLYLNEPRGMPARFFERHPELRGLSQTEPTLCTSVPEVQQFLVDSVASICRAAPGLGGSFSITASENLTHCWSHYGGASCPRCRSRSPAEVIAEVNALYARGIQQSGTAARLIAWDWGWKDEWAPEVIRLLPASVSVMSVSEWSLPIERGGIKSSVGEYSISAVGPGPRARRHWELAGARGLKTLAKIQAGNTWELSTVPYIPAVENVARHAANLHQSGINGLMLSWTLGGYPSPNLEAVAEAMSCGTAEEAIRRVAERRFGPLLAPLVVEAWGAFSTAFSQFPYNGSLLYSGPQQVGPANLLYAEPTGYAATMTCFPYDDLNAWRAIYPPEVFIRQFDIMAQGFNSALDQLRQAAAEMPGVAPGHLRALASETNVAEVAALHFRSTANQARFVLARNALAAAKTPTEAAPHRDSLARVLKEEIILARRLQQLQSVDSRFGFEASNQYFYVPMDLAEKVLNCHDLLTRWLPGAGPG